MVDKLHDEERDARIDADLAFMEQLDAQEAGETPDDLDLPSIAVADLQREIAEARRAEAEAAGQGDLASRLNDANLALGSLDFLSGLTRRQVAEVRRVWPTLAHARRLRLVRAMDELAEITLELDFSRVLHVAARDDADDVRAAAIDASWENASLDYLATLLDLMAHDDAPTVRRAAVDGLGIFANTAAVRDLPGQLNTQIYETLLAAAQSDTETVEVRRRAVAALGVFATDDVHALVEETYDRGDIDDRLSAIAAMGRTCDARWLATLTDETESEEPDVRLEATRALGELGEAEAVQDVVGRLDDEVRAVRLAAVVSLGQIGSRAAASALREHRADADDEEWTDAIDAALVEATFADGTFPVL